MKFSKKQFSLAGGTLGALFFLGWWGFLTLVSEDDYPVHFQFFREEILMPDAEFPLEIWQFFIGFLHFLVAGIVAGFVVAGILNIFDDKK